MATIEYDINFDISIDQLSKLLWVLKDNPTTRDGAAMYEKVLRDEWEEVRHVAAQQTVTEGEDIAELPDAVVSQLISIMEEVKEFIANSLELL